jgi:hypothetical protein
MNKILAWKKRNLLTDAGRAKAHAQIYTNTSAGARGCGFIAVTVNTAAPADGDTTLTGEITAGGLARVDASTKSTHWELLLFLLHLQPQQLIQQSRKQHSLTLPVQEPCTMKIHLPLLP